MWDESFKRGGREGLTLYKDPSAPTRHPSSTYPILLAIAAIPQALNLAARRPISLATARTN
jgi:hypothetical protein